MLVIIALILLIKVVAIISDSTSGNNELLKKLQAASGVYTDPAKQIKNTVIVTGCNFGFVNHLHNFECFMKRLGMKFLVISMDERAHDYITTKTSMISYLLVNNNTNGGDAITTAPQEFRSKQFNLITAKKKEAVHDILKLGYNVLFSDTDVAILEDPFPYLLWKNVDYVHSLNYWCTLGFTWDMHKSKIEGNTGFYYVRANDRTIKLWADAFAAAPRYPRLDDQAVFWKVIRQSTEPPALAVGPCRDFDKPDDVASLIHQRTKKRYLTSCYLDLCMFSSGMLSRRYEPELTYEMLMENLKKMNSSIISLHANYISGNHRKMNSMKTYNLWLASEDSTTKTYSCIEYHPKVFNSTSSVSKG